MEVHPPYYLWNRHVAMCAKRHRIMVKKWSVYRNNYRKLLQENMPTAVRTCACGSPRGRQYAGMRYEATEFESQVVNITF